MARDQSEEILQREILTLIRLTDLEATNLDAEEWSKDIGNVTSVLKLWLRELPEPLLTTQLHQGFLDAASKYYSPPFDW